MKFIIAVVIAVGIVAGQFVGNPPLATASEDLLTRRGLRAPDGAPVLGGLDFDPHKYASDAQWKQYVDKGQHLICLMEATDEGAGYLIEDTRTPPSAASLWTGELDDELEEWFWHDHDWDQDWECDWRRIGLKNAFEGQGLNADPAFDDDGDPQDGHNECISITHFDENDVEDVHAPWPQMKPVKDQHYKVRGKEYTATGGYYQFSMNRIDGAIVAKNINSPAAAVIDGRTWGRKAKPGELPELRFLSDIYWGYWVRENPNIKNIRVYGAYMVINEPTVLLTSRAFKNVNVNTLTVWPGTSFSAKSEEGKALIGSPIGATIAHMLISHKAGLGIKHITKVTVVTKEYVHSPLTMHLFFTIEDVPADKVTSVGGEKSQQKKKEVSSDEEEESQVLYMKSRGRVREHIVSFGSLKLNDA
ncbi:hypothetical protein J1614_009450 [Plenodomus biglobosus]|nr:hypothetical protein J1614_009450 [Plenodomus biglobosus]